MKRIAALTAATAIALSLTACLLPEKFEASISFKTALNFGPSGSA